MKTFTFVLIFCIYALQSKAQLCQPTNFNISSWSDPSLSTNCNLTNNSGPCDVLVSNVVNGNTYTVVSNKQVYCLKSNSSASITLNFNSNNNAIIRICSGSINITVKNPGSAQNFLVGSNASLTISNAIGNSGNNEVYSFYNYGTLNFNGNLTLNNNSILMSLASSSVINFNNGSTIISNSNQNQTSIYLNGGYMNIDSLVVSNKNGMCLAGASTVKTKTFTNNSANSVTVPSGTTGCISFSQSATLNSTVTSSTGLTLCQNAGATISNSSNKGSATLSNPCSACAVVLPVTFAYFNVMNEYSGVIVKWSTFTELNTSRFEIQRGNDGVSFTTIASLPASGASQSQKNYTFTDFHPLKGNAYYRLKVTDKDGRYTYSGVRMIYNESTTAENKLKVISSPGLSNIVVILPQTDCYGVLRITDAQGNLALQQFAKGSQQLSVPVNNLANGFYFVQFACSNLKETEHIVIAK